MLYEWDRIETTKLALMHFANANMYLHARGLEICSQVYDDLNKFSFENEFEDSDQQQLKEILAKKQIDQPETKRPKSPPVNQNSRARSENSR